MKNRVTAVLAVAVLVCLMPAAVSALAHYEQDFEGLVQDDVDALANDGWLVFGNVFGPDWGYWYGYGPFPAPNDGAAFCAIVIGQGGPDQGEQQLSVYSDYNNGDHGNGAWIESNVFQEQTVEAQDVGYNAIFDFQAKMGNLEGSSTAQAFIKTLDPANGWAMTNFVTLDMTTIPDTWADYHLELWIDETLVGQIFQFGFMNVATAYEGSSIFYDNIIFDVDGLTATEESSWSRVKSLFR